MSGSLWPGICGWYINLQFASSCFMPFRAEIVKHVCDAACVSESVCDKSCRSSLDHFNLVFFFYIDIFRYKRSTIHVTSRFLVTFEVCNGMCSK